MLTRLKYLKNKKNKIGNSRCDQDCRENGDINNAPVKCRRHSEIGDKFLKELTVHARFVCSAKSILATINPDALRSIYKFNMHV